MPRINELTSPECMEYINEGGNLAFVPIGGIERLGPHLPLGARGMVADAIAMYLAEKNGGLCLPLLPYGTLYDTYALTGSIDISPEVVDRYCRDICDELRANRIRRIVFVGFQEELYYLCHEYFQMHNMAVAWIHPDKFFFEFDGSRKNLDAHGRELWRLAACLRAAGETELLARILKRSGELAGKEPPICNAGRENLSLLGNTAHRLKPGEWMIYPVHLGSNLGEKAVLGMSERTLVEQAYSELTAWMDGLSGSIEALNTYQSFLDAHSLTRPV
ncbi:MAG: creatininase family protein [Ruthenibacterium lactatiformans]